MLSKLEYFQCLHKVFVMQSICMSTGYAGDKSFGWKGRTVLGGNQGGTTKTGVLRGHQASHNFWGRQNCSLLLHSYPQNYRHPFFQTNCKNITVKSINVKNWQFFSGNRLAICPFFVQIPTKTANSVCQSKTLNVVISSIFHLNWFRSVPSYQPFQRTEPLAHSLIVRR